MKAWVALFLFAVVAAFALRVPELDRRPMHGDEAVNAIKFGDLWERGLYKYDPTEYHGPTLHYTTAAFSKLTGAPSFNQISEVRFRIVTAFAGLVLILLLPLARDALGRGAVAVAAVFTALSPMMVFYSRYWIHEQLLVLFTFLAFAAGWNFLKKQTWQWALLLGVALGLMHATKETFIFVIAAAGGSLVLNRVWASFADAGKPAFQASIPLNKFAVVLLVWTFVWAALFSSFFTNWAGLPDSLLTYKAWLSQSGGHSDHAHEWSFYFERLLWFKQGRGPVSSEVFLLLLAIVGAAGSFRREPRNPGGAVIIRFLVFYTVLLAGIYTVIPYKTPWCALGFVHAMILLAGVGAVALWNRCSGMISKVGLIAVLALGMAHLGWQAWRGSFELSANRSNPWVYAQTSPDLLNLVEAVQEVAKVGQGNATLIRVVTSGGDCWPLPWYLRQFNNTGWFEAAEGDMHAPIVIISPNLKSQLDAKGTHISGGFYQLRPQVFLELFVERGLWERSVSDGRPKANNHDSN